MYAVTKARNAIAAVDRYGKAVSPRIFSPPYGGASYLGQAYSSELVLHFKQWVFVCCNAWQREIAGGEPLNLGRMRKRDPQNHVKNKAYSRHRKALQGSKSSHEFVPFDDDDPILSVFERPNVYDTAYDLWSDTILFYCLTGAAHWWVMRNEWGIPVEIWVIPTHWMKLITAWDGQPAGWLVQSPWGAAQNVPFDEVLSFFWRGPLNRWEGSPINLAIAEWVDAYEATVRARLAQYKNGAIPSFHVALGDTYGDPDEAYLRRYYAKWFQRFRGEDHTNSPLITGPDVEVKPLNISPVDMSYVENENNLRDMILAAYGVPKGILGLEAPTDASAYAPQRAFTRFVINPVLKFFSERITQMLIRPTPGYEDGVGYWDDRTIDDPERKLGELTSQWDRGIITTNEFRSGMGHAPFQFGGDDPILQGAPMPWATGQKDEDTQEQEQVHQEALSDHDDVVDKDDGMETTEYKIDPPLRNSDGQWFVEIWAWPSGRQVWRTPPYADKKEAVARAERWVSRRQHLLKQEEVPPAPKLEYEGNEEEFVPQVNGDRFNGNGHARMALGISGGVQGGYSLPSPVAASRGPKRKRKGLSVQAIVKAVVKELGQGHQTIIQNMVPAPAVQNNINPTPVHVKNVVQPNDVQLHVSPEVVVHNDVQTPKVVVHNDVNPTPVTVENNILAPEVTVQNFPPKVEVNLPKRTRRVSKDGQGGYIVEEE